MSNLCLNVRFGTVHLQIVRPGLWVAEILVGRSPIRLVVNQHARLARSMGSPLRWFEFHR